MPPPTRTWAPAAGAVLARRYCLDLDEDGLCDHQDVVLRSPGENSSVDCSNPMLSQPTILWTPGDYDRYRVYFSTSPYFSKGHGISTGDSLLRTTSYTVPAKKWRQMCEKVAADDPVMHRLYVEVTGIDLGRSKKQAWRSSGSQIVPLRATY